MKIVLLDTFTMGGDMNFRCIEALGEVVEYGNTSPDEVAERIADADIVALNKVVLDEKVLQFAKNLKLICVFAIGYNNIDLEYCKAHNIKVRNVPGYCSGSVCQHTFALLFTLIENMRYYDDFVKDGRYSESGVANHLAKRFFEIEGKKWGIIGMGSIGRKVASCATAFGADVCYSSISGAVRDEGYPAVSFNELLAECDIITVHAPLNEKTHHLIGEKELKMMKKTAVIINVGRGSVIDEAALQEAVDEGIIAGAALDVYSQEPPKADSPIMNVKNKERIVYTPHIAWGSVQARERCISMTADNIKAFIDGKALNDVI